MRPDPIDFLSLPNWLDGKPLAIEPYRQKIFRDVFMTEDEMGRLVYNLALMLRGKKNNKSLDLVLAALFVLLNWAVPGGVTALITATDEGQADLDLDLTKKLIRANELLSDLLTVQSKSILRRDGDGLLEIRPGKDFGGQHGGKFDFLGIDEIHTQPDYRLLEALAPDPTRESLTWICSYNTLHWKPGVPLFDMIQRGWKREDRRMYFSAYTSTRTTDPDFADAEPERRANPSMDSWLDRDTYLIQQKTRLPSHMYRRLHLCEGGLPEGAAFTVERIDAAIERGVRVKPPQLGIDYVGFVDPSGGSNDDMCLAIAHKDFDGRAVLDLIMNQGRSVPFDPLVAVELFARVLKEYHIRNVTGDRYGGARGANGAATNPDQLGGVFPNAFQKYEITYAVSELTASQLYQAFEPKLNSGQVILLDNETMESQFLGLVWRGGKIDHPASEHDDWSNSVAGAIRQILYGVKLDASQIRLFGSTVFSRDQVWETTRTPRAPWD